MEAIKIFISYQKSQDGHLAALLKQNLELYFGFKVFLAHDDLPPSIEWEEEIPKRIKDADFFIPLLSEAFKKSEFTDQETGMACAWHKKIIPIKLDGTNPYGFIRKYHALKSHSSSNISTSLQLRETANIIFFLPIDEPHYTKYREQAIFALIELFMKSRDFSTTNTVIATLIRISNLSKSHIARIEEASRKHTSYYQQTFAWSSLVSFLHNTYNINLDI